MISNEILIRPVLTEKATFLREKFNKYVFIVHKKADKISIKRAIKEIFNVEPIAVNIINKMGKKKRVRYKYGYTPSIKKAIVTLKKGDKIGIFEGV